MLTDPSFWVFVALVIFLGLAGWKGLRPIVKALDARAERIRESLEEAQALREEAQRTLADYKRKQREALKDAQDILAHAESEAKRIREEGRKDIEAALQRREALAMEKIAQAEAKALQEVRGQTVDLAIAATARLLGSKIDSAKAEQLIDDTISELPRRLG